MARINAAKNFAGKAYATQEFVTSTFTPLIEGLRDAIKIDGTGTQDGIGSAIASILDITSVADGQDTYKIKSSVLPDLALTDVIVIEATSEDDTVSGLINANIPENGVQEGDVFVITATDGAIASKIAGSYIITQGVANGGDVEGKFVKLYTQEGHVTSVGGAAPVGGAVSLKVSTNLGGDKTFADGAIALTYSDFVTLDGNLLTVGDKVFEGQELTSVYGTNIGKLRAELGAEVDTTAEGFKSVYDRLSAIEESIGDGEEGIAAQLEDEVEARKADDLILKNAVESAVKLSNKTVALSAVEGVVTVTMEQAGLVFAVLNDAKEQVYPSISYNEGVATLVADYEDAEVDANWTIYYADSITAQLANQ